MRESRWPSWSAARSGSQREPQMTLMTFQPAPRKFVSSSWMILPLPRTGPSSRCRLQLMTKIRLSRRSRPAMEIAPAVSGSSIPPPPMNAHTLPPARAGVARDRPPLPAGGLGQPAALQVLHEARLVDGHQRPPPPQHLGDLLEL